jgi:hypothetical protein
VRNHVHGLQQVLETFSHAPCSDLLWLVQPIQEQGFAQEDHLYGFWAPVAA